MNMHRPLAVVLPIAGLVMVSGCASIMSGRNADVAFSSNAPNTHVVVRDKRGQEVASVEAPAVVSLKRKDRFIWPARYTATFEAPGHAPVDMPIKPRVNPWIAGNILAGGLIGLAVDNVTGAAWKPQRDNIMAQMAPIEGAFPAPQVAASPPVMERHGQSPMLPGIPANNQSPVQPTAHVDSAIPLPTSPGLQRTAVLDDSERPLGGATISVGNTLRF
jgi:hypothetical protein